MILLTTSEYVRLTLRISGVLGNKHAFHLKRRIQKDIKI